jgi:hypothetical protein
MVFRKPLEIAAGGSVDVPLSLAVPSVDGPVLTGEVALAGDALACDDKWNFALPVRHPIHALVVEHLAGIGGGMKPSFFLTRAIAAGGAGKATAIESDAWLKQSTEGIGSLWFTGGSLTNKAAWEKAMEFANAGGTVVVTGDSQPEPLPADWPVTVGEEARLPAGRMATRLLASDHILFDGVWSDQTPFPPLPQRIARSCVPANGGKLLAMLAGGYPFVVEAPRGKGRVFWLNASADRTWGDLPLSPAFVALIQQLARAQELALQTTTTCWVGEAWPDISKFSIAASWPRREDGESAARPLRSGLFDAISDDGKPLWRCAVNVRRAESDLRSVEAAKLQAMLPGKVAAGQQGIREWREEIRREVPLWPWLLTMAALVFLAEGWMSARAAKQRAVAAGGGLPKWMERRAGV